MELVRVAINDLHMGGEASHHIYSHAMHLTYSILINFCIKIVIRLII